MMNFRERDGVCVTYDVRGIPNSTEYPYVNDLPTLKAAVAIAKTYPGVYGDGSSTHIIRNYAKLAPPGSNYHHSSGCTHRWRVEKSGNLMLNIAYARPWKTTRQGIQNYYQSLPKAPTVAEGLRGQLWDIAMVADHIGMNEVSKEILAQLFSWRRDTYGSFTKNEEIEPDEIQTTPDNSWWNKFIDGLQKLKVNHNS